MARPKKCRKVCALPSHTAFVPKRSMAEEEVVMSVDEYETIRLIDLQDLAQEECAKQMQIARTTVQAIYIAARKKLADCIVHGKTLLIDGGDVEVCDGENACCARRNCCCRYRQGQKENCCD